MPALGFFGGGHCGWRRTAPSEVFGRPSPCGAGGPFKFPAGGRMGALGTVARRSMAGSGSRTQCGHGAARRARRPVSHGGVVPEMIEPAAGERRRAGGPAGRAQCHLTWCAEGGAPLGGPVTARACLRWRRRLRWWGLGGGWGGGRDGETAGPR